MGLRITHTVHQVDDDICIQTHLARYGDGLTNSLHTALRIGEGSFLLQVADARQNDICVLSGLCHKELL